MNKHKPSDFGYNTFVSMYDDFKERYELAMLNSQSVIKYAMPIYDGNGYVKSKVCKIKVETLERLCWQEINDKRLNSDDVHLIVDALYSYGQGNDFFKILEFLRSTQKDRRGLFDLLQSMSKNYPEGIKKE